MVAHAGSATDHGAFPMSTALSERFTWTDLREDVHKFVTSFDLCALNKGGNKFLIPLSTIIYATELKEVIDVDYLLLGDSSDDRKYELVFKGDLRGQWWLELTSSTDSENTAEVLRRWKRIFTAPKLWVSYQGSSFKNEVIAQRAWTNRIRHKISVAFSPWVHGTVESLMCSVLSETKAMIAELKLAPKDCSSVLPDIASSLN